MKENCVLLFHLTTTNKYEKFNRNKNEKENKNGHPKYDKIKTEINKQKRKKNGKNWFCNIQLNKRKQKHLPISSSSDIAIACNRLITLFDTF